MSSLKIVELTDLNTCKICENAIGKYSCPKCEIIYCSLPCYQSDSHLQCSESFYKDEVMKDLKLENSESSKAKMEEILKAFHEKNKLEESISEDVEEEYDDDDDNYEDIDSDDEMDEFYRDIGERLNGIDLDDSEEVWDKLNADERQEFEAFLQSGDVSKYVTMWQPWWEYRCEKRIIEITELDEHKSKCPKIKENIQTFSVISPDKPGICDQHNLINIIAAYAFALRYFNGEQLDFAKETASFITNLSLTLKNDQNFDSFNQAVNSVTMECTNTNWIMADKENLDFVKTDVHMIMSGPHSTDNKYYLFCALSDLNELFVAALQEQTQKETKDGSFYKKFTENQFQTFSLCTVEDLNANVRKIEYFLSFVKDCYEN